VVLQPDPTGSADDQLSYTTTGGTIDPDLGDTKTGLLKLPLNPLGALKPSAVSRRQPE
jgi:hypothetical protein